MWRPLRPPSFLLLGTLALVATATSSCGGTDRSAARSAAPPVGDQVAATVDDGGGSALYVLRGNGAVADGRLTVADVGAVTWFDDRPRHDAGRIPAARLLAVWADSDFARRPPNAAVVHDGGTAVVELSEPDLDGSGISFAASAEGDTELPDGDLGAVEVFIDDGAEPGTGDQPTTWGPGGWYSTCTVDGMQTVTVGAEDSPDAVDCEAAAAALYAAVSADEDPPNPRIDGQVWVCQVVGDDGWGCSYRTRSGVMKPFFGSFTPLAEPSQGQISCTPSWPEALQLDYTATLTDELPGCTELATMLRNGMLIGARGPTPFEFAGMAFTCTPTYDQPDQTATYACEHSTGPTAITSMTMVFSYPPS